MLYLLSATLLNGATPALRKLFNKSSVLLFSAISTFGACIFFVFSAKFKIDFSSALLPYSMLFAITYATNTYFSLLALKMGNLMITGLVFSFSLLIPTFFGLVAYNEESGITFWLGLLLLCASLLLINFKPSVQKEKKQNKKLNIKYLVALIIGCVTNGCCSTIQTAEQKAFSGRYKSEFMIVALLLASIALFVLSLVNEREHYTGDCKQAISLGSFYGISNGMLNLFVMFSVNSFPASIVFPIIGAGGIVINSVIAVFFFKEKYTHLQYLGMLLGICSVVFLNL